MSQNPQEVTNPDLVDVADQGEGSGALSADQPVLVGTSSNPGPLVQGGNLAPGTGTVQADQPVTVSSPATTALATVQGGTASPQSPDTINTTENTVINQVYGTGSPTNVYVS